MDCNKECGGHAAVDSCGECGGVGVQEPYCDCLGHERDCLGVCGGKSQSDVCGVCNGPGIHPGKCSC